MEIRATRTGEQLVLSLAGRMDGTGAQQVTSAIQQNLTDHDSVLIFELGGVDYMSSAGLRVFQESARRMKERKGSVAVCRPQEFVRKLFTAGGFTRILNEFPSVEAALAGTATAVAPAPGEKIINGTGWSLTARHLADVPGILSVTGSIVRVHDGKVTSDDIRRIPLVQGEFSIATGAMAKDVTGAAPLLGEMVQAGSMVYWIPTDGNLNPDFFTAKDLESSGMNTFTLFAASFSGPFADVLRISSEKPEGITLTEVYDAVYRYLREQYPDFSGVCAVAIKATIGGICSADMKTSVMAAAAEYAKRGPVPVPVGRTVTELPFDGSVAEKVSAVDVKPKYAGDILIGIGYAIEPAAAGQTFSARTAAALYYDNPRSKRSGPFQCTKGIIYRNLHWDNARAFDDQIRAAPANGQFVAMHNLLAISTVRSAVVGVIPVREIRDGA